MWRLLDDHDSDLEPSPVSYASQGFAARGAARGDHGSPDGRRGEGRLDRDAAETGDLRARLRPGEEASGAILLQHIRCRTAVPSPAGACHNQFEPVTPPPIYRFAPGLFPH